MKKYNKLIKILLKAVLFDTISNKQEYGCFSLTNFKVVKNHFIRNGKQVELAKRLLPNDIHNQINTLLGNRLIELSDYQHHKHFILINYRSIEATDFYFVFDGKQSFKVSTLHSWLDNKEPFKTEPTKRTHGIPYWISPEAKPAFAISEH